MTEDEVQMLAGLDRAADLARTIGKARKLGPYRLATSDTVEGAVEGIARTDTFAGQVARRHLAGEKLPISDELTEFEIHLAASLWATLLTMGALEISPERTLAAYLRELEAEALENELEDV